MTLTTTTTSSAKAKGSMVLEIPSNQVMVDSIDGWVSIFPPASGVVTTGISPLFTDDRVLWAFEKLGGVAGRKVVELGPLEGAHTYMLQGAGASQIIAIEANTDCFFKCLVTKEIFKLNKAEFLLGNFMPWLQSSSEKIDVVWASGVLYHMTNPAELLYLIGDRADAVYIWSHYIPDNDEDIVGDWTNTVVKREERLIRGEEITHFHKIYGDVVENASYCGGVYEYAARLRRRDILACLHKAGFTKIEIGHEVTSHPVGPFFAIVAMK